MRQRSEYRTRLLDYIDSHLVEYKGGIYCTYFIFSAGTPTWPEVQQDSLRLDCLHHVHSLSYINT